MSNAASRPNKTLAKSLNLRLAALRAELTDPLTIRCGAAAAKCINETIAVTEAELARVLAS